MPKILTVSNAGPGEARYMFECPGCKCSHGINDSWQFNHDLEKPTISPSILVRGTEWLTDEETDRIIQGEKIEPTRTVCHSFIREGKIEFLSDCTHELAGQTIELPDWDDDED